MFKDEKVHQYYVDVSGKRNMAWGRFDLHRMGITPYFLYICHQNQSIKKQAVE